MEKRNQFKKRQKTNETFFTFVALDSNGSPVQIDQIFPKKKKAQLLYDSVIERRKNRIAHNYPELELIRLTIPRWVYTQVHKDVVADSVKYVYQNRDNIRGLKMIYEPKYLRFFQSKFESC